MNLDYAEAQRVSNEVKIKTAAWQSGCRFSCIM